MPGNKKPLPIEASELTLADARQLLKLADAFTNERVRRMRAELRGRLGDALRIPAKRRGQLDCLESNDVFLLFLPG